jgi:ATP-binding cassette subfamily G (WHITE) protein 2 (PDR)
MISTGVAHAPVQCASDEFILFEPPSGQSCAAYMQKYIDTTGGYLRDTNATTGCQLCPVSSTDTFLAAVGLVYEDRWRNFGIMIVFTVFNAFAALALYWLVRVPKKRKSKEMKEQDALLRQKTNQSVKENALARQQTRHSQKATENDEKH